MNKLINKYIMIGAALFAFACDKDDLTGDSPLTPSAPSVSIALPGSPVAFVEKDSTLEYTITLSEPQIVDVDVYVTAVGGNASEGDDFTIGTSIVRIPANSTTAKAVISVKADNVPEDTETFTIQIGDERTANASITPQTIEFTIMNVSADDLPIHFSWDTDYFDATGSAIAPDDVADMILYITDANGDILPDGPDADNFPDGIIDGAAFEDYVFKGTDPDGVYYIKAGIYDVIDPGALGDAPVLDLSLDYSQVGKLSESTLLFPAGLTGYVCEENVITLAKITKTGTSYVVEEAGTKEIDIDNFTGAYSAEEPGYDGSPYAVNFTAHADPYTIINDNFWDAAIALKYVLDPQTGTVTIPGQVFDLSAFGIGEVEISGSGTFNVCSFEMVVDYTVVSVADGTVYDDNTHTFEKP